MGFLFGTRTKEKKKKRVKITLTHALAADPKPKPELKQNSKKKLKKTKRKRTRYIIFGIIIFLVIPALAIGGLYAACKIDGSRDSCRVPNGEACPGGIQCQDPNASCVNDVCTVTNSEFSTIEAILIAGALGLFLGGAAFLANRAFRKSEDVNEELDEIDKEIDDIASSGSTPGTALILLKAADSIRKSDEPDDEKSDKLASLLQGLRDEKEKVSGLAPFEAFTWMKNLGVLPADGSKSVEVEAIVQQVTLFDPAWDSMVRNLQPGDEDLTLAELYPYLQSTLQAFGVQPDVVDSAEKKLENELTYAKYRVLAEIPPALEEFVDKIKEESQEFTTRLSKEKYRDVSASYPKAFMDKFNAIDPTKGTSFKSVIVSTPGLGKTQLVVNFIKKFPPGEAICILISRETLDGDPKIAARQMLAVDAYARQQTAKGRPVMLVFDEAQGIVDEPVLLPAVLTAVNTANYNIIATTNERKLFDGEASAAVGSRFGGVVEIKAPKEHPNDTAALLEIQQKVEKAYGKKISWDRSLRRAMKDLWTEVKDKGAYRVFNENLESFIRAEAAKQENEKEIKIENVERIRT